MLPNRKQAMDNQSRALKRYGQNPHKPKAKEESRESKGEKNRAFEKREIKEFAEFVENIAKLGPIERNAQIYKHTKKNRRKKQGGTKNMYTNDSMGEPPEGGTRGTGPTNEEGRSLATPATPQGGRNDGDTRKTEKVKTARAGYDTGYNTQQSN